MPLVFGNSLFGYIGIYRDKVCRWYWSGASSSIGSMQAMYSKQSVDHACNVNDESKMNGKEKATSLPDILLVDLNQCEVSQSSAHSLHLL